MTAKQRVMAALNHQRPDRIPTFDSFWEEFRQGCVHELSLPANTDLADYFGIDIRIAVADETPFPSKRKLLHEDSRTRTERDSWGRVVQTVKGAYFYRELDVAVQEKKDLDRLQFDSPTLDSHENSQAYAPRPVPSIFSVILVKNAEVVGCGNYSAS